jgi:hypothetical protein
LSRKGGQKVESIKPGDPVIVRNAAGNELPKIALTGVTMGQDFRSSGPAAVKSGGQPRMKVDRPRASRGPPRTLGSLNDYVF